MAVVFTDEQLRIGAAVRAALQHGSEQVVEADQHPIYCECSDDCYAVEDIPVPISDMTAAGVALGVLSGLGNSLGGELDWGETGPLDRPPSLQMR